MIENSLDKIIEDALREDIGMGDVTSESTIDENQISRAIIIVKESGILSGIEIIPRIFSLVDDEIEIKIDFESGSLVTNKTIVANIIGPTRGILMGERVALNFLQRMSGIATLTHKFVHAVSHTKAKITDTRKTAPLLRLTDKISVHHGGGVNHRFGLDDMVLIKDNHISAVGSIEKAIVTVNNYLSEKNLNLKIEIEVDSIEQLKQVLSIGKVNRIMLDNFLIDEMKIAVQMINNKFEVEASGKVNLQTVKEIAETGVDFISIGALTHSVKALDISLEIIETYARKN